MIGIYELSGAQNLCHVVDSIEAAAKWIGCHRRTLYYNLHISGVMMAKNYFIERIDE